MGAVLPTDTIKSFQAAPNFCVFTAEVSIASPPFFISSSMILPTALAISPVFASSSRSRTVEMLRLSKIKGDFRPIPRTREFTR